MIMIVLAVIEFGNYFVKREIVTAAISTISQTLQRDPAHVFTPQEINSFGSSYVKFNNGLNNICADAYITATEAANAPACTDNSFNTSNPNPDDSSGAASTAPYFVSVRARVTDAAITPLGKFVPAVNNMSISSSSGATQVGTVVPPDCQPPNLLSYSKATNSYGCTTVPTCQPGQILRWTPPASGSVNSQYLCDGAASVIIGNGLLEVDVQGVILPNGSRADTVHCGNITFAQNVTTDITKISPSVVVYYPNSTIYVSNGYADSHWGHWTTHFSNVNLTNGTARICIDTGGLNLPIVYYAHVLWSITYIP